MSIENATVKKVVIPDRFKPVLGAAGFYVIMMAIFIFFAPDVFLNVGMFTAVFLSLPLYIIMGLALVFVTVAGEIDLSFPSILALSGLVFAVTLRSTDFNFWIAFAACLATGIACGLFNGFLVTKLGFSSLITTLGVNFMFNGLTQVLNRGEVRQYPEFDESPIRRAIVGSWGPLPAQLFWGIGIAIILGLIFHRHRFGIHVHIAGDNPDAGRAMCDYCNDPDPSQLDLLLHDGRGLPASGSRGGIRRRNTSDRWKGNHCGTCDRSNDRCFHHYRSRCCRS